MLGASAALVFLLLPVAMHLLGGEPGGLAARSLAAFVGSGFTNRITFVRAKYGYAEEYDVSRYFVDARVLSIFALLASLSATTAESRMLPHNPRTSTLARSPSIAPARPSAPRRGTWWSAAAA